MPILNLYQDFEVCSHYFHLVTLLLRVAFDYVDFCYFEKLHSPHHN